MITAGLLFVGYLVGVAVRIVRRDMIPDHMPRLERLLLPAPPAVPALPVAPVRNPVVNIIRSTPDPRSLPGYKSDLAARHSPWAEWSVYCNHQCGKDFTSQGWIHSSLCAARRNQHKCSRDCHTDPSVGVIHAWEKRLLCLEYWDAYNQGTLDESYV